MRSSSKEKFKKPKPEVSEQRGMFWLFLSVVSCLLASFLFKKTFSSERISSEVGAQIQKLNQSKSFQVAVEPVHLKLSRGWLPALGFETKGLIFTLQRHDRRQDQCEGKTEGVIRDVFLPIRLSSLLAGDLRFSEIRAGFIEVNTLNSECKADEDEKGQAEKNPKGKTGEPASSPSIQSLWQKIWKKAYSVSERLSGIRSDLIWYQVNGELVSELKDLHLKRSKESLSLEVNLNPHRLWRSHSIPPMTFFVKGELTPSQIAVEARSNYREGMIVANAEWSADGKDKPLLGELRVRHLPLTFFRALMLKSLNLDQIGNTSAWISCSIPYELNVASADKEVLFDAEAKQCVLEGSMGRFETAELRMSKSKLLYPVRLKFTRLSLDKLTELIRFKGLDGTFETLGESDGEIRFQGEKEWSVNAFCRNSEIPFSRRGRRELQKVNMVELNVERKDAEILGRLERFEVEGGEFKGSAKLKHQIEDHKSELEVNIEKLNLNPKVEQLMMGARSSGLKVVGLGRLTKGELEYWKGVLAVQALAGEGWKAEGVALQTQFSEKQFVARGEADILDSDSAFHYDFLPKLIYGNQSHYGFKKVKGVIFFNGIEGRWENVTATTDFGFGRFRSLGKWTQKNGELEGEVWAEGPKSSERKLKLKGTWAEPKLL